MNSIIKASNLLKNLKYPLNSTRSLWITSVLSKNSNRNLVKRDFDLFESPSRLVRKLDREFEYIKNQMLNTIGLNFGLKNPEMINVMEDLATSPIIVDKNGDRHFEMSFDLAGFEPEEVKVKTEKHNLIVRAKKESSVSVLKSFIICFLNKI
jgi:HSP20 family molecular chaperone IbpA